MPTSYKSKLAIFSLLLAAGFFSQNFVNGNEPATGWWRFRGPNGTGVCDLYQFPANIAPENIVWKIALDGVGHSSPVAANGRVFVASADPEQGKQILAAYSIDSGKMIWQRSLPGEVFPKHAFNSFASSTPTLDEERLFYAWATPKSLQVVAIEQKSGKILWNTDLGPFVSQHGFGASPIVYGELLILPNEQDGESFIVALDCESGTIRWKTPRKSEKAAYSTPTILRIAGMKDQLVLTSWAHGVASLDPQSGKPLWELPIFHHRTVGSPLVVDDLIVASSGEGGIGREMFVVRAGIPETGRQPKIHYEIRGSLPYVTTPVAYQGLLYLLFDKGIIICQNVDDGQVFWKQRIPGEYFSSPLVLGGKLYCLSRSGTLVVLATGKEYQLLGQYDFGEATHATPAVADGLLLIRTLKTVFAIKAANRPLQR
ncbi:MAG: outer membrane protein assembly factor BamB family protein [Thermogutta sp.]